MFAWSSLILSLVLASVARGQAAQSTPPPTSTSDQTGIPSVWVPPTSTNVMPSLVFSSVPTLTACATAQVDWTLHNDTGLVNFDITLNVVEEEGHSDDTNVSMTLTKEDAMDPSSYNMNVTLPLGQYYFQGVINDIYRTSAKSNVFEVVQGPDSSCLNGTDTPSTTPSTSPVPSSGSKSLSGGAIAGIVIGVLVVIAVAIGFVLWRRRSRGGQHNVDGAWIGDKYTPGLGSDMLYNNQVASPAPADYGRRHLGSATLGVSTHTLADPPTEISEASKSAENPFESQDDGREVVGFAAYLRGR